MLEDRLCLSLALSLSELSGISGTPFSATVSVSGLGSEDTLQFAQLASPGAPPVGSSSPTPPPGLTFDAATGELSGTPTTPGAYTFVVAVTDYTIGQTASAAFPLTITSPVTVSGTLTAGMENTLLTGETITASGPAGHTYTFTSSGTLPPGVSLTAGTTGTTVQLTGTPTQWGTYSFEITATSLPKPGLGSIVEVQAFQMTINPAITFSPPPLANIYSVPSTGSTSMTFLNAKLHNQSCDRVAGARPKCHTGPKQSGRDPVERHADGQHAPHSTHARRHGYRWQW